MTGARAPSLRARIHHLLRRDEGGSAGRSLRMALVLLIVVSVGTAILKTVPSVARAFPILLDTILLLTTESSDAMKAQGRAAGATGWLVKPFDPATLLEVVQKVLK